MAGNGPGEEPGTAPQADRWYTLRLGSSFKEDRPSSKFCTLRYEFKPASIDKGQPGSLNKSKENRVTVEFHNNQPGKPKVTFEGTSEDCKENDGVLFFDGETFRLERVHRAVKRLRHVRLAGESVAASAAASAVNSTTSVAMGMDSRSSPLGKMARSQPLTKSIAPSVPLEVERIDIGEPRSPVSKPAGKSADKDSVAVQPNPAHASPDRKSIEQEEDVDIDMDDEETMPDRSRADEQALANIFDVNITGQNDTDDDVADVDISDDDRDNKGHGAPEDARNAKGEQQTSSSSGSSGSGSSGSGSGSGSSSSDSDGSSDDDSASSGGDVDIDGDP